MHREAGELIGWHVFTSPEKEGCVGARIDVLHCNSWSVMRELGISFPAALAHEEGEFSAFCSSEVK